MHKCAQLTCLNNCGFLQSKMMNSRLSSLILLLHIQGSLTLKSLTVSCGEQNICAVRGTQVTMKCFYSNVIKTGFWFSQKQRINWKNKDEPEDLTLDSDYSGRVDQEITYYYLKLSIDDLRERDSGKYQLMIIMKDGVKHLSSVTVNLTVTVLQVKMNPESTDEVKLSCDSSCKVTSDYYNWYKNGRMVSKYSKNIFEPSRENTDSYSCSEYEKNIQSSSVCPSNSGCWGVTYTSTRVCALVGSTVDIHSSYSHPTGYTVKETYWHLPNNPSTDKDLREERQFSGRVEYVGNTLRIKDINTSDSGQYAFRFITYTSDGKFSGLPGVTLTVTDGISDTQVLSSPNPVIDGEKVILSCSTKCTLDNKHTYIWYKNGQQVTDGLRLLNKLYMDSINSKELPKYSCTVREQEKSTWLRNTAIILSVFLTLALIGGLMWYRMRSCILSRNHKDAKEEAQYDSVHIDAAPSEHTQKEDCKYEDIHYCSINFVNSKTKQTSSETTENEDVQYATVMFS